MIEIAKLSELAHAEVQAVIINCGTKWVSSLALLSTVRNTGCPVLIVNCESRDGSREHFQRLCANLGLSISWLEWPLRPHHVALDQLFREIKSDQVLLVDSDLEILSRRVFTSMLEHLSADRHVYGSGFLHGPLWVGAEQGLHEGAGYYMARMWIPLTLLRTDAVRTRLNSGVSFAGRRSFRDPPGFPRLAKVLGYRYRIPYLRRLRLPRRWSAARIRGTDSQATFASYLDFDTGAVLHQSLLAQGYRFAALPEEQWSDVRHFHGVTRSAVATPLVKLVGRLRIAFTDTDRSERSVLDIVRSRLASEYGVKDLGSSVEFR